MTPFEEYCDPKSDYYVNIARFGQNPRYKDENLLPECYTSSLKAYLEVKPKNLVLKEPKKPTHKMHNCDAVLEEVCSEELITAMRKICISQEEEDKSSSAFVDPLDQEENGKADSLMVQPLIPRELEKLQEAALLIQSVIRGRAVQNLMLKGRRKQQDLIDEIKSTHAFVEKDKLRVNFVRALILKKLRQYHYYLKMIGQVAYVHERLTGATLSYLADIAYKEMERIEGERRAHMMAAWAEKTRMRREAAEGGRRQKELRLRVKHDEYYKHVIRKTEITTETYLKLLKQGAVFHVSKKEADYNAQKKADEIEKEATEEIKRELDFLERQEISAQLLHGFYVPRFSRQASMRYHEKNRRKSELIADRLTTRQLTNVLGDDNRRRKETHLIFSDRPDFRKPKRPTLTVCKCKKTSDIREHSSGYLKNLRRVCSISSTNTSSKDLNELLEDAKKEHEKALRSREKLKERIKEVKMRRGLESESIYEEDVEFYTVSAGASKSSVMEMDSSSQSQIDLSASPSDTTSVGCPFKEPAVQTPKDDSNLIGEQSDSSLSNFPIRRLLRPVTTRGLFTDDKLSELAENVADGVVVEAETRHYALISTKESVVDIYRTSYLESDEEKTDDKRPSIFFGGAGVADEENESEDKPAIAEHFSTADKWNDKQMRRTWEMIDRYAD